MIRLVCFLYDALWCAAVGAWCIFRLLAGDPKSRRRDFRERLALYPRQKRRSPALWLHASSLGEVLTLTPLMKKLRLSFPQTQFLSVSTVRGRGVAEKSGADATFYLPWDFSPIVRKALRKIRPDILIVLETEIWPNLFRECSRRGIPVLVVSGRISSRSFPRYRRIRAFLPLADVNFAMQSEEDRERILALGAKPERVRCAGNIKFDGLQNPPSPQEIESLRQAISPGSPTIVAGSTHAGEEAPILEAYRSLRLAWPECTLILAPRHMERLSDVTRLAERMGLEFDMRSALPARRAGVVILDTYGELAKVYALADVVFVGGSLVPVGGHNLMEPAALGKPVVTGPWLANCRQQADLFRNGGTLHVVNSGEELRARFEELLSNPRLRAESGAKAREIVLANRGALDECLNEIRRILANRPNL